MMKQPVIGGTMVRPQGGAPKRFSAGRVCAEPDCSTRLATYNRDDTCFRHSPIRFPRTRTRTRSVPNRGGGAGTTSAARK